MSEAERGDDDTPTVLEPPAKRGDPNAWMVTFTDLVALMLTFFVMIFAMSSVKTAEWQNLSESLRRQLSTVIDEDVATPSLRLDMPKAEITPGADLDYLAELMRAQLEEAPPLDASVVRREPGRVFVSLPADLLFAKGRYALDGRAAKAVFALGGVLENVSNRIEVAGHADPEKPTRRYPSNWELSLLRAESVAAALREAGYDGPIIARGYGDAQYATLPEDLPPERRAALARRVDIVIHEAARERLQ